MEWKLASRPIADASRIKYLDGLRGIAILVVMLFHSYARWPQLYPYGNRFDGNPIFDTGITGVRLFFLISGFVILMTLQNSPSFLVFMKRRWIRLFPAMLICSLLIYLTSDLFPARPQGTVRIVDLLPGLTFTGAEDGNHLWDLIGGARSLEGAFWSLYAEVKFYIIFGAAYFLLGEIGAICTIVSLLAVSILIARLHFTHPDSYAFSRLWDVVFLCRTNEYGWFAAGALAYLYAVNRSYLALGVAIFLVTFTLKFAVGWSFAGIILSTLFFAALIFQPLQRALSNRMLLFVGFASYPLYLLHENILVASIARWAGIASEPFTFLVPIPPALALIGFAWLIAKHCEPAIRSLLQPKHLEFSPLT